MGTEEYLKGVIKRFDLKNKSREQKYLWDRRYFCYFAKNSDFTYMQISKMLGRVNKKGKVDHTFSLNNVKRCQELIDTKDQKFITSIQRIANDLNLCPKKPDIKPPRTQFLEVVNRVFECRDMEDLEALKAYINENVSPNDLKQLNN